MTGQLLNYECRTVAQAMPRWVMKNYREAADGQGRILKSMYCKNVLVGRATRRFTYQALLRLWSALHRGRIPQLSDEFAAARSRPLMHFHAV